MHRRRPRTLTKGHHAPPTRARHGDGGVHRRHPRRRLIAAFLFKLGLDDNWFFDELKGIIERALRPGSLFELLQHIPLFGIRLG